MKDIIIENFIISSPKESEYIIKNSVTNNYLCFINVSDKPDEFYPCLGRINNIKVRQDNLVNILWQKNGKGKISKIDMTELKLLNSVFSENAYKIFK